MFGGEDIKYSLISAVREGNLERARELINSYGLSYSPEWSHGYVLLCDAVENKRAEVTKLLLTSGSIVNSNSTEPSDTPLHFAARNGDIEIIKMLLDKGANISAKNQSGRSPLYESIKNKAVDVTELLLRHGANVNARDNDGLTPLHLAAETECLQMVENLLNNGASVNCVCTSRWKKGYAPLHFAVEKCSEELIKLLLSRGAHVDVKGEDGITPLHISAGRGHLGIVEGLINHGACINSSTLMDIAVKEQSRRLASERGCEAVVKLLLQHGAKVDNRDKDGKTVLHLAVETGNVTIIEDILKYCPDINDQSNRSSLKIAVHGSGLKYKEIVEALLEYGFSVTTEDANDLKLLFDATVKGCLKVIEDLLKYGADVNGLYYGFTPLHTAAKRKQEEVAKLLISCGADINAQDKTHRTPIFYAIGNADLKIFNLLLSSRANIKDSPELLNIAVEKGCMEIVEALLQGDVDVKASDEYGRTALHYIGSFDRRLEYSHINIKLEIAKLLLSKGATVDAQTENGETPLHRSAQKGNKEITIMLLNKGANVNAEQKDGTTPLHVATDMGCKEVVEVLLEYGADINSRDKDGRTALHFASQTTHVEVVSTLLENGADINITSRYNETPLDLAKNRRRLDMSVTRRSCEAIVKILKCNIVKLETANLYISEKNLKSVASNYAMRDFQNECEEEIANIKSEKFNNINISFYDILAKGTSSLAVYMRNEDIVQVLKSGDYKTEFPIYASMLKARFKKGMERKELLEQANKMFHSLFNTFPELPYDCTEQIFSYLSDKDLKNFNRCLQASKH